MRRTAHGLAGAVSRFFDWWLGELAAMIPQRLRRLLHRSGPVLLVEVAGNELIVSTSGGRTPGAEVRIATGDTPPAVSRQMIAQLLPAEPISSVPVFVRLAPAHVLRRTVEMPLAAEENLRQVLSFDMDRQTPFTVEQVYYDFAVTTAGGDNPHLRVDLVVALREVVDGAVAVVRSSGLEPTRVEVAWPSADGPRVNLLQRAGEPRERRLSRPVTAMLAALTLALLVAAIALPLRRQGATVDELREQVMQARRQAEVGRKLQEDIDRRAQQGRFIIERKVAHPSFVEALNELTQAIPDETWLFRLRAFGPDVQIFGYSSSATALIGLIEQSPLFEDTQFRAPLTRDARNDAERFHVGFRMARTAPGR